MLNNKIKLTINGYNKIAEKWNQTRQKPWVEVEKEIEIYLKDNLKIIDIGCGNGRSLFTLQKYKNLEYLGIDPSEKLIEIAKQNFPQYTFEVFDGVNFSKYKKKYYDLILSIAVLHHIPEEEINSWLSQIKKLGNNNAIFIFTSWISENNKHKNLLKNKEGIFPFMDEKNIRYIRNYDKKELENIFKKNNFNITKIEEIKREKSKEKNILVIAN